LRRKYVESRTRSWRGIVALAAVPLLLVAGCTSGGAPEDSQPITTSGGAPEDDQPITLEFTTWDNELAGSKVIYAEAIAQFEEAHPNVTVNHSNIPASEYSTVMTPQMAAGAGPDIYPFFSQELSRIAEAEWLLPLDDFTAESDILERLPLWTVEFAGAGGEMIALPRAATPYVLHANRLVLEQAGISEVPTDFDGFYEAAKAVSEQTDDTWGYMAYLDPSTPHIFYRSVSQWTLGFGSDFGRPGEITVDVPEVREALTWLKRFIDEGITPFGVNDTDGAQLFVQGDAAFVFSGTWTAALVKDTNPELYEHIWVERSPLPTHGSLTGGGWVGINASSEHPELAWEFLEILYSPEMQIDWTKRELRPMGTIDSPDAAWIEENAPWWDNLITAINEDVSQLGYAPPGFEAEEAAFRQELVPFLIEILAGNIGVEEGLQQAQAHMETWAASNGLIP
jgi:multiple sugar transport system substrate-binding protein